MRNTKYQKEKRMKSLFRCINMLFRVRNGVRVAFIARRIVRSGFSGAGGKGEQNDWLSEPQWLALITPPYLSPLSPLPSFVV
jgi:hypothetical protein